MTLKEFLVPLNDLVKKYPDIKVIYAQDVEGNYYDEIRYGPLLCRFKNNEIEDVKISDTKFDAICIN